MKYKNKKKDESILIVTYVFPTTPIYKNKIIKLGSIIAKVNNEHVSNIEDYKKQIMKSAKYVVVVLENNKIEVINIQLANKINTILTKQFNVLIRSD